MSPHPQIERDACHNPQSTMVSGSHDEQQPLLDSTITHNVTLDEKFNEYRFLGKLFATSFNYFVSGIAVTALGALVPSIESFYNIPDGTVAAIFPCTVGGYLCSTASIQFVHLYLGRRGLGWLSSLLRFIAFVVLATGPPFPICLVTYSILGFGTGLTDSGWSAWGASLRWPNVVQGPLHSSFGVGCILGPMLAVAIINRGYTWHNLYAVMVLLVIIELAIQLWAFWSDTAKHYRETHPNEATPALIEDDREIEESADLVNQTDAPTAVGSVNPLRFRGTWLCCAFFFVYVSIEFTYSDWIVTYMRRARHTPYTTAGLASSIFWLGMSIGRIGLGPITERFGVKRCVIAYLFTSACFQIAFKNIESTALALVMLALNGSMLSVTFPSGLVLLSSSVPRHAQVGAVAAACAVGQIGGASVPFMIGFMAERVGIDRLLDVVLALTAILIFVWLIYCKAT